MRLYNDIEYNRYDDFSITPRISALKNGLKSYYQTNGNVFGRGFNQYLYNTPNNGIVLSSVKSSEFLLYYSSAITFIHLFFEHTIISILKNVNPFFVRGDMKNEKIIGCLLSGYVDEVKLGNNNIKYSASLDRLDSLITYHSCLPEKFLNGPQRKIGEVIANAKTEGLSHYRIHKCPCCGVNTLTTFDYWKTISTNKIQVCKAECIICTYKVDKSMGEPSLYKIMDSMLFEYV